jgi:hypothetical protein
MRYEGTEILDADWPSGNRQYSKSKIKTKIGYIVAWENCLGKYEIVNHNIEDKNSREKIPPIFRPIFSVLLLSVLIFADDLFLCAIKIRNPNINT